MKNRKNLYKLDISKFVINFNQGLGMALRALKPGIIEAAIKNIINSGNMSVILTLIGGDLLFGDLDYIPHSSAGTCGESENTNLWIPNNWRINGVDYGYKLRPVCLAFNSKRGIKHGWAYRVEVRDGLISGIRPLPWTRESLSFLTLKNVPNPIASWVCEHNLKVIQKYDLHVYHTFEKALSETGIPPHGINFAQDEIIYVDWEFFSHISGGSLTVGIEGIAGLTIERSLYQLVLDKLTTGVAEKLTKFIPGKRPLGEQRLKGYLVIPPNEITTDIEGIKCMVVLCSDRKFYPPEDIFIPVLLKEKALSYPKEFLKFIKSKLIFYGEIKQIPIRVNENLRSDYALIARAVGYIKNFCE